MNTITPIAAAILALAITAPAAHAAISVNVFPKVTAAYAVNPDGTVGAPEPVPNTAAYQLTLDSTSTGTPAPPTFYEVHFYLSVTGADSTHSLGAVAFGIDGISRQSSYRSNSLGPGHPASPTQGLAPSPGSTNTDDFTDANSNPVSLSTFAFTYGIFDALVADGSGGYSAEGFVPSPDALAAFTSSAGDNNQFDLEAMVFSLKTGKVSTTQRTIGQSTPFDLGYVRVYWNQSQEPFYSGGALLKINDTTNTNNASVQFTVDSFPSSASTAAGTLGNAQFAPDTSSVDLGQLTPEPASLTLLACGIPFLLRARRSSPR